MNTKVIVIVVILLFAGGLGFAAINNDSAVSSIGTSPSGSPDDLETAPDFSLQSLSGETLSLASYQGDKPVVLDFWASWCPNCRRDMPKLNRLYEEYKDQLEVIGINLRESEKIASDYVNEAGIDFPVVLDTRGKIANDYNIQYTNTHILIDTDGNIVDYIPGDIKESDLKNLLSS